MTDRERERDKPEREGIGRERASDAPGPGTARSRRRRHRPGGRRLTVRRGVPSLCVSRQQRLTEPEAQDAQMSDHRKETSTRARLGDPPPLSPPQVPWEHPTGEIPGASSRSGNLRLRGGETPGLCSSSVGIGQKPLSRVRWCAPAARWVQYPWALLPQPGVRTPRSPPGIAWPISSLTSPNNRAKILCHSPTHPPLTPHSGRPFLTSGSAWYQGFSWC